MKLLEATGWQNLPAGGSEVPGNLLYAFTVIAAKGVKELELTREELLSFIQAFSDRLTADIQIAKGDFYFWGVHITANQ